MARLILRTAFGAALPPDTPLSVADLTLTAVEPGPVTSIAPFRGATEAVSARLAAALGADFPEPGQSLTGTGTGTGTGMGTGTGTVRLIWAGQGRALLLGAPPPDGLSEIAACVDQTGAQAFLRIEGASVTAVLARLVPLDLRDSAFATGSTARTMLGHMTVSVTRTGPAGFEVMALRSMAGTLLHEITQAAEGVAARP